MTQTFMQVRVYIVSLCHFVSLLDQTLLYSKYITRHSSLSSLFPYGASVDEKCHKETHAGQEGFL
jgi:hypothetical protein